MCPLAKSVITSSGALQWFPWPHMAVVHWARSLVNAASEGQFTAQAYTAFGTTRDATKVARTSMGRGKLLIRSAMVLHAVNMTSNLERIL